MFIPTPTLRGTRRPNIGNRNTKREGRHGRPSNASCHTQAVENLTLGNGTILELIRRKAQEIRAQGAHKEACTSSDSKVDEILGPAARKREELQEVRCRAGSINRGSESDCKRTGNKGSDNLPDKHAAIAQHHAVDERLADASDNVCDQIAECHALLVFIAQLEPGPTSQPKVAQRLTPVATKTKLSVPTVI